MDRWIRGNCYPREYGGLGLPVAYQHAFDQEASGYELPYIFSVPTMAIVGPTILECGTEEQKRRYIPAFLRGDELWVQFMSEPGGGSDMAGALSSATRDGDIFRLQGSKIWSTYAYRSDLALALVRTNWDAPKHRGLTMIIVPIHHPGVTVTRIRMVDGSEEFCQEFFDGAEVPVANVVGEVNGGWSVATRLLYHERTAVGGASPYLSVAGREGSGRHEDLLALARRVERTEEQYVQRLLGEARMLTLVENQLIERVNEGIRGGQLPAPAGSLLRLYKGMANVRRSTIALEIAGEEAVAWMEEDDPFYVGVDYVQRQARAIGGGTVEMARNMISERLMGMPPEPAADRDVPFNQVRRGRIKDG